MPDQEVSLTEIERECIRRIAEAKGLPPDQIGLDTTLDSIGVDSLDRVSLSFDLEEQYGVELPDSKLQSIKTVGDVAHAVNETLLAKAEASGRSEASSV